MHLCEPEVRAAVVGSVTELVREFDLEPCVRVAKSSRDLTPGVFDLSLHASVHVSDQIHVDANVVHDHLVPEHGGVGLTVFDVCQVFQVIPGAVHAAEEVVAVDQDEVLESWKRAEGHDQRRPLRLLGKTLTR